MDMSGCQSPFSDSEIRRFLDENTSKAYANLRIAEDLRQVQQPRNIPTDLSEGGYGRCSEMSIL